MKNKLQKTNMTRFDHRARKLGIIGALIMAATFALCVPVAASLISSNKCPGQDITIFFKDGRICFSFLHKSCR